MSTDLELRRPASLVPSADEATQLYALAEQFSASGMFKDATQVSQAFTKIVMGRDLGIGPTMSMMGIDLIEGKPSLSANLQAAILRQYRDPDGWRYDYRATVTGEGATVWILRIAADGSTTETGCASFGPFEAQQANLVKGVNYGKYPANMYFARAMSNAIAWFAPEVTYGTRTYSEGELTGELIEPSPVPVELAMGTVATTPIVSNAPGPPSPTDPRHCRSLLRDAVVAKGLEGAEAIEFVQGALNDMGAVGYGLDLDARLRALDDVTVTDCAHAIQRSVEPSAELFIDHPSHQAPATTTNAIAGD